MSLLYGDYNKEKELSFNDNYLWSEINNVNYNINNSNNDNNKFQNITTTEDYTINNLYLIQKSKYILDSKYYLIKKIGQGSSGKVYLGFSKDSLNEQNEKIKYYSIKLISQEKIDLNAFNNEIYLLGKISHKNILNILGYGHGPKISLNYSKKKYPKEFYYIVSEYLEHYELSKYITNVIKDDNIGFNENFGRLIFSQLLDGLESIHNLNICHRDIKLNNIILGENDYILKYIDFGMGAETGGKLENYLGTEGYAAPELHMKKPYYGKAVDIFALGVTLFILVTGRLPFKLATPNDSLYQYIARNDYIEFWKNQSVILSPSFMELFDSMVAYDYIQRPSISEIRQSAWMKEINWDLMPLLKQEFILREEKIKINEEKKINEIISKENIINKKEPLQSLLDPYNYQFSQNNINKDSNINSNEENMSMIKTDESKKFENRNNNEGSLIIKTQSKCLLQHMTNIKRFLRKKGYVKIKENIKKNEIEITNGEIDIYLNIQKFNLGYIKLNYNKLKGNSESFKEFRNEIFNIKKFVAIQQGG